MSIKENKQNGLIAKWGYELFDDGITNAPQCFMRYGRRFVKSTHFQLICCIISYQYGADAPFPTQKTIADNMGISVRRVRTLLSELEEEGHAEVIWRFNEKGIQTSNEYSFKPLLDKCLAYSQSLRKEKEKNIKRVPKPKKIGAEHFVHPSYNGAEQSVHPEEEQSIQGEVEHFVPGGGEQSVPTKKEREERKINKEIEESVCSEEQQIIALLESRSDVDSHIHKQLTLLLNAVKKKDNFQYFIFRDTLDKVDFDIQNIGYFKRALTNNLKEGSVWPSPKKRTGTIIRKERVPEWLDEKENEEANVSKQSQPNQYTEEKIRELKERLAKYQGLTP